MRTRPCRQAQTCGLTYCTVRMPRAFRLRRQPEIELRAVDADEDVGPPVGEGPHQLTPQPPQPRQVRQHLGQAHDREFLRGSQRRAAGGEHLRAGDAAELDVGCTRAQASISAAPSWSPDASPATSPTRSARRDSACPGAHCMA